MKVELKKLPKSEVELTVTVPYADYKKAEETALKEVNKNMTADGFRSGHIPEDVVRQKLGKEGLMGSTLDVLLPETYAKAIFEHKLQVISRPKVDIKKAPEKEGDDLIYIAVVAVMPEVKLGNYKKLKVKKEKAEVLEKELQETIDLILERYATWKDANRASKMGDRVEIGFEGFDEKGEVIPNTVSKNHPIVLGSKMMIPGFEEAVAGMKVGENKEFDITFPKDYHAEPMKGKTVKFKVSLNKLEEKMSQALDEKFIESNMGKKMSVAEFKEHVKKELLTEKELKVLQEHQNKVVEEVSKITTVELPDSLIEEEIQYMIEDQKGRTGEQGLTWEQYLKHIKKTEEDLLKEWKKPAEERLVARLGIQHLIQEMKIEVSDDDVEAELKKILENYPKDQGAKIRDYYKKGGEAYRNLHYRMVVDKLIEGLSEA